MRLTNYNALIWNVKCTSHIITTNYLNYFKVITTMLQSENDANPWCFQASNFHMGISQTVHT